MLVYILIVMGFLMRVIPHVPNVAPVAAIALFAGAYLDRRVTPWVPLAIMVASDLIIGLHDVVLYTWGAFVLIGFLGTYLKNNRTTGTVFTATVFSAALFFIITNFGVWLAWYPHTWQGMSQCYVNAIPFLRNMLIGNIVFAAALFGTYEFARRFIVSAKLRTVLLTN